MPEIIEFHFYLIKKKKKIAPVFYDGKSAMGLGSILPTKKKKKWCSSSGVYTNNQVFKKKANTSHILCVLITPPPIPFDVLTALCYVAIPLHERYISSFKFFFFFFSVFFFFFGQEYLHFSML